MIFPHLHFRCSVSGKSYTITGTLASQIVMECHLNIRIHPRTSIKWLWESAGIQDLKTLYLGLQLIQKDKYLRFLMLL